MTAPDEGAWTGVQALVEDYLKVRADDAVVLAYTGDAVHAAAWVSTALQLRGARMRRVPMTPLADAALATRLDRALPDPDRLAGRLVVLTLERDTMSHAAAFTVALSRYPPERRMLVRVINAGPELFRHALTPTPEALSARNAALLEHLMPARRLRIVTDGGTDLTVRLEPRYRWISSRGSARAGGTVVLPAGEVATFPAAIDGVLVADFAFNVNALTDRDARLERHPVTVEVRAGRAERWSCRDRGIRELLDACLNQAHAVNVGELGFGTNPAIEAAIALNSHINERRRGIHLGFGQHNQAFSVVPYRCPIHLDLVARGGYVWADAERTPVELDDVRPSPRPHPDGLLEQDLSAPHSPSNSGPSNSTDADDCCGILSGGELRLFHPAESLP